MTGIQVVVVAVGRWRRLLAAVSWTVPWQTLDDHVPSAADRSGLVKSQGVTSCVTGVLRGRRSAVVVPCFDEHLPACRSVRVLLVSGNSQARRTGMQDLNSDETNSV